MRYGVTSVIVNDIGGGRDGTGADGCRRNLNQSTHPSPTIGRLVLLD